MLIFSSSSRSDNICLNFSLAVLLDNGDCSSKSSSRNKLIALVLDPVLFSSSDSLVVLSLLLSELLLSESSSSDPLLSEPSLSESLPSESSSSESLLSEPSLSESSLSELSGFWNSGSGSSTRLRFDEVDCVVTLPGVPISGRLICSCRVLGSTNLPLHFGQSHITFFVLRLDDDIIIYYYIGLVFTIISD